MGSVGQTDSWKYESFYLTDTCFDVKNTSLCNFEWIEGVHKGVRMHSVNEEVSLAQIILISSRTFPLDWKTLFASSGGDHVSGSGVNKW